MRRRLSRVPIIMSTKSINQMRAHYLSMGRGVARFAAVAALSVLVLAGCSGGGAATEENPIPPNQVPGSD